MGHGGCEMLQYVRYKMQDILIHIQYLVLGAKRRNICMYVCHTTKLL